MIQMRFGWLTLNEPEAGIWVTGTNIYSAPYKDVQADSLALRDGALVVKQTYRSKNFTVEGMIRGQTRSELEQFMDTLKTAMAQKNTAFDVVHNGATRRYLVNAVNVIIADRGLTSATWLVEFMCPDGFGWSLDAVDLITPTAITQSTASFTRTLTGSHKAEPVFRLEVSSVVGGSSKTVQILDGTSLRGVRVTRDWIAGDVLEVDSLNRTVYVNNVLTDFQGQFPVLEKTPLVQVNYLDDFTTSRSVILSSYYTPRWL